MFRVSYKHYREIDLLLVIVHQLSHYSLYWLDWIMLLLLILLLALSTIVIYILYRWWIEDRSIGMIHELDVRAWIDSIQPGLRSWRDTTQYAFELILRVAGDDMSLSRTSTDNQSNQDGEATSAVVL